MNYKSNVMTQIPFQLVFALIQAFCISFTGDMTPLLGQQPKATEEFEILLDNRENSNSATIKVEPIGMVFNDILEYSDETSDDHDHPGLEISGMEITVADHAYGHIANHVTTGTPTDPIPPTHIGYGKYKVTIDGWGYIFVDFSDADYSNEYGKDNSLISDVILEYNGDDLVWWGDTWHTYTLSSGDVIEIWDQRRINNGEKAQNRNGFKINSSSESDIPIDVTGGGINHYTPGQLFVNLDIEASATVLSGKSFIIQEAGTQLTFSNNTQLTVNGTLTADNATFTATSGSSWKGIAFASGSGGTLQNCTVDGIPPDAGTGGAYAAIQIDNASPTIAYSTIDASGGGIGISVSGTNSAPSIHHNTITSASAGLRFYDAGGFVDNNQISKTNHQSPRTRGPAVIASVYADPYLSASGNADGNNKIYGFDYGLWAETGASIWTGSGYNCIDDHASYDAFAMDGGTIYAQYNWWGGGAPDVDTDEGSAIYYTPYLTDGSCPAAAMAPKVAESEAGIHSSVTAETVVTAGDDPHALLLAAKQLAVAREYEGAIQLLKDLVAGGPESSTAGLALVELGRLARQTRDAGLAQYLADQAEKSKAHRATVLGLLVSYYRSADDDHTALAEAALLADEYPGTWQAFYAQVSAFRIHLAAGRLAEAAALLAALQPTRETEIYELALAQQQFAAATG